MKKLFNLSLFLVIALACIYCDKKDNDPVDPIVCEHQAIISLNDFNNAPTDEITLNSWSIKENCLTINFSSSGCDGDTWKVKLIDSGVIMESHPIQRSLILSLENKELCEAYITKEVSFDISELKIDAKQVILNISNTGDQILYSY